MAIDTLGDLFADDVLEDGTPFPGSSSSSVKADTSIKDKESDKVSIDGIATIATKSRDIIDVLRETEASSNEELESKVKEEVSKLDEKGLDDLRATLKSLVDKGKILLHEDKNDISEYSREEIEQLIIDNLNNIEDTTRENSVLQFVEDLPDEIKVLIEYYYENGKPTSDMFRTIADVMDGKSIADSLSDEQVLVLYYKNKGLDDDVIGTTIDKIKASGKLEEKAKQVRQEIKKEISAIPEEKVRELEQRNEKLRLNYEKYVENVAKALDSLNIPNKELKEKLYKGLSDLSYDSISGKKTNKLNHLIEKYQVLEPNLERIIEVLWLLEDRDSFIKNIYNGAKSEVYNKEVMPKLRKATNKALLKDTDTRELTSNNKDTNNKNINLIDELFK